jgi:hypothetical protein
MRIPIHRALATIVSAMLVVALTMAIPARASDRGPSPRAERMGGGPVAGKSRRGERHRGTQRRHRSGRRSESRGRGGARRSRRSRKPRRTDRRYSVGHAVAIGAAARSQSSSSGSSSSLGDLLFSGSRIADFAQLQAAPGAISEVLDPLGSGESTFMMTVSDNDVYPVTPTENPRAQALSPPIVQPGDEFWLRTKFMLPADFPRVSGWMSLVSIYGPPFDGSSPWQIGVGDNEIHWQRNGTYGYDVPWQMPLTKGRWISVLLHERFATDGWVEMWIDGQQVTFPGGAQRLDMQTVDSSNDGGANHAKIMQYREAGMFDSATVYFGSLQVGVTRASVEG